jgi:NADPH:quinone reductase
MYDIAQTRPPFSCYRLRGFPRSSAEAYPGHSSYVESYMIRGEVVTMTMERSQLQMRSLIRSSGELELSLVEVPITPPGPGEVLVRIEAAPLNPSDHGLLFGTADMNAAVASGTDARPIVTAPIPASAMRSMAGRLDQSLTVGNEGSGLVVETGNSEAARALMGKRVAALGGAMYSQYRTLAVDQCLVLPDGATAAEGASAFINPMTALGMIDTMRREGHTAIVHSAAASNLGQMLHRLCAAENIKLVNIVRSEDQVRLLQDLGATFICNTHSAHFAEELANAVAATGATIAFDAIGGGTLAGQILKVMELVASKNAKTYSRYGSTVHKQVYVYGGLDPRPTELARDYGMVWGIGGWLVMNFMQKIGAAAVAKLKERIGRELKTTFASTYSAEISLRDALRLKVIADYRKRETGKKYLVNPNKT